MTIKKQIEKAIKESIKSLSEDIQRDPRIPDNIHRAKAIKEMAEAYDLIHRRKKNHE